MMCAQIITTQLDELISFIDDCRFNPFEVSHALEHVSKGGRVMIDEASRSITLLEHSNDNSNAFLPH